MQKLGKFEIYKQFFSIEMRVNLLKYNIINN